MRGSNGWKLGHERVKGMETGVWEGQRGENWGMKGSRGEKLALETSLPDFWILKMCTIYAGCQIRKKLILPISQVKLVSSQWYKLVCFDILTHFHFHFKNSCLGRTSGLLFIQQASLDFERFFKKSSIIVQFKSLSWLCEFSHCFQVLFYTLIMSYLSSVNRAPKIWGPRQVSKSALP